MVVETASSFFELELKMRKYVKFFFEKGKLKFSHSFVPAFVSHQSTQAIVKLQLKTKLFVKLNQNFSRQRTE